MWKIKKQQRDYIYKSEGGSICDRYDTTKVGSSGKVLFSLVCYYCMNETKTMFGNLFTIDSNIKNNYTEKLRLVASRFQNGL